MPNASLLDEPGLEKKQICEELEMFLSEKQRLYLRGLFQEQSPKQKPLVCLGGRHDIDKVQSLLGKTKIPRKIKGGGH